MRICIVMEYHPDDLVGGAEIQVFGLACRFAQLGHEVTYVCQRYDRSRPVEEIVDGVRVLRVLRWHRAFRFVMALRLFRTLRALRPDVVYQRSAQFLTGLVGVSARVLSVPFVWGCSQDESLQPGFLVRQQGRPAGGPARRVKHLLLRLNARISQSLFHAGLRRADALVVQNSRQVELLRTTLGRSGHVIPNGIALAPPRAARSPEPMVLWLNRISRGKNAEAFIELARSLQAERPGTRFALVGGRQNDAYYQEIGRLAAGLPNLELTGMVPPAEVREWYEQAWVYVLTSVDEGFPNVLLEAWAAGVPVVSLEFDPDGLIAVQGLGLLSGTEDTLRRDVCLLLDDAGLREKLASAARAYVAENLGFSEIAERYLAIFQGLLK